MNWERWYELDFFSVVIFDDWSCQNSLEAREKTRNSNIIIDCQCQTVIPWNNLARFFSSNWIGRWWICEEAGRDWMVSWYTFFIPRYLEWNWTICAHCWYIAELLHMLLRKFCRFVEGDFDTYVSHIREPHVWGGEPELFMASHVLQ